MLKQKKTILLVEDEVIIGITEKVSLEKYGYNVIIAINGDRAIEIIKETPEIDLILMDINLGSNLDGTQTAELILQKYDIPIVFLSSHSEPEIVEKTEKITSYGYIIKSSGITVIDASIKMAFKLFDAKLREKEKEKALRESEESLAITLQSIGDAVIATDIEGKVTRMNPIAERLTGWSFADAKDRFIDDIFNIVNAQTNKAALNPVKSVIENGEIVGLANHTLLISKDGNEYQISDSGSPIKDKEGNIVGVVLVFRDVTEEYRMLDELREREQMLNDMAANVPGIIYQFYAHKDGKTGFYYISPRANDIFGFSDDPNSKEWNLGEQVHPDDKERFMSSISDAITQCKDWNFEGRLLTVNGIRWFRGLSRPMLKKDEIVFNGIMLDITDKSQ